MLVSFPGSRPEIRPFTSKRPRVVIFSDATSGRNGVGSYYRDLVEHLQDYAAVTLVSPCDSDGANQGWLGFRMPGVNGQLN